MIRIIKRKRDGHELSKSEIEYVINGLLSNEIPEYQIAAFLMAIYFNKLSDQETLYLTEALLKSGKEIDLSSVPGIKVDKHSTGGVGDKTTIILAPLVAAAGIPFAKISGRGLGHTGGTIDKLESISGFNTDLTIDDFVNMLRKYNIVISAQSEDFVPADMRLYALRDVTATVDNIGLITSSIMSKKLATGADAIVIDLKIGYGAFIKDIEKAEDLARSMITIGESMNRKVVVLLSNMNQPIGNSIGNALELKEAIDTLKGNGPDDLRELCLALGANMLLLAGKTGSMNEAKTLLIKLLNNGKAFEKFKEFVESQGGNILQIEDVNLLPTSKIVKEYICMGSGYITELNALEIGLASVFLGAGRVTKSSKLDYGSGIVLKKKIGEYVKKGEALAILHTDDFQNFQKAEFHLDKAYKFSNIVPPIQPLIFKTI